MGVTVQLTLLRLWFEILGNSAAAAISNFEAITARVGPDTEACYLNSPLARLVGLFWIYGADSNVLATAASC